VENYQALLFLKCRLTLVSLDFAFKLLDLLLGLLRSVPLALAQTVECAIFRRYFFAPAFAVGVLHREIAERVEQVRARFKHCESWGGNS
jgi:hypothetical protein